MIRRCVVAIIVAVGLAGAPRAHAEPPLVLERTIPLHDVRGRIDHMAVDLGRKRLLVAELGNGTVDAIDLSAGTVAHRLTGLHEPQGVGYAEGADVILVANARDGSVRLFGAADFSPAAAFRSATTPTTSASIRATGWPLSAMAAADWR